MTSSPTGVSYQSDTPHHYTPGHTTTMARRTPAPTYTPPTLVWYYPEGPYREGDIPDHKGPTAAVWNYRPGGHNWEGKGENPPTPQEVETHKLRAYFQCAQCEELRPTPERYGFANYFGGTGYGYAPETQAVHCYRCCAHNQLARMVREGTGILYLVRKPGAPPYAPGRGNGSAHDWQATDWGGELTLPILGIRSTSHNWRNVQRTDVWAIQGGYLWHGINLGDSQILRLRRTRTQWIPRTDGNGYTTLDSRGKRGKWGVALDGGAFCPACANGANGSRTLDPKLERDCPEDRQWILATRADLPKGEQCSHCGMQNT